MIDMSDEILSRMQKEYTVSEVSAEIKRLVENSFAYVRVKGEIFGAKRADSGHWYLSLKDENSLLSAVCWRGIANNLPVKIEDGVEVVATGKITTFNGRSSYQLVIEHLEIAGVGALLKLLEERKQKFLAEGLFDSSHKQKIPYLPKTIGVVTSPTGAVIRDIIHRITDRFPCRIIVWPTAVQGEGCAEKIAQAINGFNSLSAQSGLRPDVLIVARGGGSLEDLWPFNDELVVRAVYNSQIPLISAVGHETDTMLIDYAADVRAPTPTGAAEFAVPVKNELFNSLINIDLRMKTSVYRYFSERKQRLQDIKRGIPSLDQIVMESRQKLDERTERLKLSFLNLVKDKKNQIMLCNFRSQLIQNLVKTKTDALQNLGLRMESVSVESVLKRGFSWVKDNKNKTVYNSEQAKKSGTLKIQFADDCITVKIDGENRTRQLDLFS